MAQTHYKTLLRKVLLGFITKQDPVVAMLAALQGAFYTEHPGEGS
jgi:hypothetical protein